MAKFSRVSDKVSDRIKYTIVRYTIREAILTCELLTSAEEGKYDGDVQQRQ